MRDPAYFPHRGGSPRDTWRIGDTDLYQSGPLRISAIWTGAGRTLGDRRGDLQDMEEHLVQKNYEIEELEDGLTQRDDEIERLGNEGRALRRARGGMVRVAGATHRPDPAEGQGNSGRGPQLANAGQMNEEVDGSEGTQKSGDHHVGPHVREEAARARTEGVANGMVHHGMEEHAGNRARDASRDRGKRRWRDTVA